MSCFGFEIYEKVVFLGFFKMSLLFGVEKLPSFYGFIVNCLIFLGIKVKCRTINSNLNTTC